MTHLVDTLGRRHRSLDRQAANVLPSLLQQRDEVVDGQHDVGDQLILSHSDVSDGDTHAQDLLQLELNGGLDFVDLGAEILVVGDRGWEFTSLGKTGTQETWDLLDEGIGSDEGIVLASKLLDELLVLVELLQVISGHGVDTTVLRTIDIVLVTKNAILPSVPCSLYVFLHLCIRMRRTRCSCLGGGRLGDGWFRRNACHVEGHSS